jgi:hypothetical protein
MHYLQNSEEIRTAINSIYSTNDEKWAIVGFVGYGALDQLPSGVKNLSVICWPKPGATSPDGVRRLQDAGIKVYFCDRLHSKIYWASGQGAVIGSANLSKNALTDSGQHEFGVIVKDVDFDIKKIIGNLKYKLADEASLNSLEVARVKLGVSDSDSDDELAKAQTFLEETEHVVLKRFKIVSWHEFLDDISYIEKEVKSRFNSSNIENSNVFSHEDIDKDSFQVGDYVLQISIDEEGEIRIANCKWLRVELIIVRGNSTTLVQVHPSASGVQPPFVIDSMFKKNLKAAWNSSSWEDVCDKKSVLKKGFIDEIRSKY